MNDLSFIYSFLVMYLSFVYMMYSQYKKIAPHKIDQRDTPILYRSYPVIAFILFFGSISVVAFELYKSLRDFLDKFQTPFAPFLSIGIYYIGFNLFEYIDTKISNENKDKSRQTIRNIFVYPLGGIATTIVTYLLIPDLFK